MSVLRTLQGTPASPGIAIGPVRVLSSQQRSKPLPAGERVPAQELARLRAAQKQAEKEIQEIYERACTEVGEGDSVIFQIHILMLQDEGFQQMIRKSIVEDHASAEYAVWSAGRKLYQMFSNMEDEYMRARSEDMLDISRRLLMCLNRQTPSLDFQGNYLMTPAVLCLTQAVPSQIIRTNHSQVLALVTQYGSSTSHSAILARGMGKPAVVGLGEHFKDLPRGEGQVIVDGTKGVVIVNPTPETLEKYTRIMSAESSRRADLAAFKGMKTMSADGVRIHLLANINSMAEIQMALENDAEGAGLVRSEFLYSPDHCPTEEEQYQQYSQMLAQMGGRRVIVRTLDLDSSTSYSYLGQEHETNPAMGLRSVRLCLRHRDLFRTQIRAMLRASVYGRLGILVPFVNDGEMFRQIRMWIQSLAEELKREGKEISEAVSIGVMIETPAAALQAHELAREADFFNIGTNDLTQFTLAVDRENRQLKSLYNPSHPAVKRLIAYAARAAHEAGIPVCVSGEAASDYSMLRFFLRAGIQYLSAPPPYILELRREIGRLKVRGKGNGGQ